MNDLKIKSFKGKDAVPYLKDLANLRIAVFREYPYLYVGDHEYESNYLRTFVDSPESLVILVFVEDKIIGASTALPLQYETIEFQQPFLDNKINIEDVYYFGESVLLPSYRKRGIYPILFKERESVAKDFGAKIATFCVVERDPDDHRKPKDYIPLDKYWERLGYMKHPEIFTYYEWKEVGEDKMTPKKMIFRLKTL